MTTSEDKGRSGIPEEPPYLLRCTVTKHSWRGKYRRLLCLAFRPPALVTLDPHTLAPTNRYDLFTDFEQLELPQASRGEDEQALEFTLHVRTEGRGKFKPIKFSSRYRTALLTGLHALLAIVAPPSPSPQPPSPLPVAPASVAVFCCLPGPAGQLQWRHSLLCISPIGLELLQPHSSPADSSPPPPEDCFWCTAFQALPHSPSSTSSSSPAPMVLLASSELPAGSPDDAVAAAAVAAMGGKSQRSSPLLAAALAADSVVAALLPLAALGGTPVLLAGTRACNTAAVISRIQGMASASVGAFLRVDTTARPAAASLLSSAALPAPLRLALHQPPLGEWRVSRTAPSSASLLLPFVQSIARQTPASGAKQQPGPDAAEGALSSRALRELQRVQPVADCQVEVTSAHVVERDPATYEVLWACPLSAVSAVVLWAEEPLMCSLEFADSSPPREYKTADREALLAAVKDAAEAQSSHFLPVLPRPTFPGHRIDGAPCGDASFARDASPPHPGAAAPASREGSAPSAPAASPPAREGSSEAVSLTLRHLIAAARDAVAEGGGVPGTRARLLRRVFEFNACVPFSGLPPSEDVPDVAAMALLSLLPVPGTGATPPLPVVGNALFLPPLPPPSPRMAVLSCHVQAALFRMAGAASVAFLIVGMPGAVARVLSLTRSGNQLLAAQAMALICRLIGAQPNSWDPHLRASAAPPSAAPPSLPRFDLALHSTSRSPHAAAKAAFFPGPTQVALILARLRSRLLSPLLSSAVVSLVSALILPPFRLTTPDTIVLAAMRQLAHLGRRLFALSSHPSRGTRLRLSRLVRAITRSGSDAAHAMRAAALRDGAWLRHMAEAVAPPASSAGSSIGSSADEEGVGSGASPSSQGDERAVSRQLVALWTEDYDLAMELMARTFPAGLLAFLHHREPTPAAAFENVACDANSSPISQEPPPSSLSSSLHAALPRASEDLAASASALLGWAPGAGSASLLFAGAVVDSVSQSVQAALAPVPSPLLLTAPEKSFKERRAAGRQGGAQGEEAGEANGGERLNWALFWRALERDHATPELIWTERTRQELREGLQAEAHALAVEQQRLEGAEGGAGEEGAERKEVSLCWNFADFRLRFPSLAAELCVAGVYLRLFLQEADASGSQLPLPVRHPSLLFSSLYHRFLREADAGLLLEGGSDGGGGDGDSDDHDALLQDGEWCDPSGEDGFTDVVSGGACSAASAAAPSSASSDSSASTGSSPAISNAKSLALRSAAVRESCARAMALLSERWGEAATAGFDGAAHVTVLLDRTMEQRLRHRLLLLLESLVLQPRLASSCVAVGGVELAVDLLATAHAGGERVAVPLQSNLLTASAHVEPAKEWHCTAADGTRLGPLSRDALLHFFSRGRLRLSSLCWAEGWSHWRRLAAVRELRWAVGRGPALLTPAEVGASALRLLHRLLAAHAAALRRERQGSRQRAVEVTADAGVGQEEGGGREEARDASSEAASSRIKGQQESASIVADSISSANDTIAADAGGAQAQPQAAAGHSAENGEGAGDAVAGASAEDEEVLVPMPRVIRILADPRCLPHVAQALLTCEPTIVASAARLLLLVARHNPLLCSRLHTTGAFFFACAYPGSNLRSIAELFKHTHLRQALVLPEAAACSPLLQHRSVLGPLLPESLLFVLERRGAAAFAAAMAADSDSPELVWTQEMRARVLIPQVAAHLGDFPHRLAQHCKAEYDFSPIPPITYPQLRDEMWCHRYYLRNLCDEARFPDWPIAEHVPFLQAMLAMWRAEVAQRPAALSTEEALETMEIAPERLPSLDEELLKRQYRRLAVRFHPDKNPAGRDRFVAVQQAYEHLLSSLQGLAGPQPWRLLLLLRAQAILFRRCPTPLRPFQYPAFPLLLEHLRLPAQTEAEAGVASLAGERLALAEAAARLLHLVCTCSALNAAELLRVGGLPVVATLLSHCRSLLSPASLPSLPSAAILSSLLQALAVAASLPGVRAFLASSHLSSPTELPAPLLNDHAADEGDSGEGPASCLRVPADVVTSLELEQLPDAVQGALESIVHMARNAGLRAALLRAGALWFLLPLMLQFDPTAEAEAEAEGDGNASMPGRSEAWEADADVEPPTSASVYDASMGPGEAGAPLPSAVPAAWEQQPVTRAAGGPGAGAGAGLGMPPHGSVERSSPGADDHRGAGIGSSVGALRNKLAALAARAVARLTGYDSLRWREGEAGEETGELGVEAEEEAAEAAATTEQDAAAHRAIQALLTERLAAQLAGSSPLPLLATLAASAATPQVIWSAAMRRQLLQFVEERRSLRQQQLGAEDLSACEGFSFGALRRELQVGGVFLRLFIQQPDFPLDDPEGFAAALIRFLQSRVRQLLAALQVEGEEGLQGLRREPTGFSVAALEGWGVGGREGAGEEEGAEGEEEQQEQWEPGVFRVPWDWEADAGSGTAGGAPRGAHVSAEPSGEAGRPQDLRSAAKEVQMALVSLQAVLTACPQAAVCAASLSSVAPLFACLLLPPLSSSSPLLLSLRQASLSSLFRLSASSPAHSALLAHPAAMAALLLLLSRQPTLRAPLLALLQSLSSSSELAWAVARQGGLLFLLALALPAADAASSSPHRSSAAHLLASLLQQPLHGGRLSLALSRLLPPAFLSAARDDPTGAALLAALSQPAHTPELIWNAAAASFLSRTVASLANTLAGRMEAALRQLPVGEAAPLQLADEVFGALGEWEWDPPDVSADLAAAALGRTSRGGQLAPMDGTGGHEGGSAEGGDLQVAGVFLGMFLRDPRFPLRHPKRFLEGLLDQYTAATSYLSSSIAGQATPAADRQRHMDRAELLASALLALLRSQPSLCDHVAQLGFPMKLAAALALPVSAPRGAADAAAGQAGEGEEEGGSRGAAVQAVRLSCLRLVHLLAANAACCEMLSAAGTAPSAQLLPHLIRALGWAHAPALSLETIKRLLQPSNRSRDTVVALGLRLGLVPVLLALMDSPSPAPSSSSSSLIPRSAGGLSSASPLGPQWAQSEASVCRVLAAECLRLLAADGPYAIRVREILAGSQVWASYRHQKLDLLLPAPVSATSSAGVGVAGLLTSSAASPGGQQPLLLTGAAAATATAARASPSSAPLGMPRGAEGRASLDGAPGPGAAAGGHAEPRWAAPSVSAVDFDRVLEEAHGPADGGGGGVGGASRWDAAEQLARGQFGARESSSSRKEQNSEESIMRHPLGGAPPPL